MRAHRYTLELPIRYRRVGDQTWLTGRTANISYSGVLFRASALLDINTEIEISIALSTTQSVRAAADLICQARIVRTEPCTAEYTSTYAAAFSDFQFVPTIIAAPGTP